MTAGQQLALNKIIGGSGLAALGIISVPATGTFGATLYIGGSALAADGLASGIAELLGGDTSAVPAIPPLIILDIVEGATTDYYEEPPSACGAN